MKKFFTGAFLILTSLFSLPQLIFAQAANGDASNVSLNVKLSNPIQGVDTFQAFLAKVLHVAFVVGIPVVALFIIYSGFLFVTAAGSEDKLKTAKATFLWTCVGAAILLGAEVLSHAILGTVTALGQ